MFGSQGFVHLASPAENRQRLGNLAGCLQRVAGPCVGKPEGPAGFLRHAGPDGHRLGQGASLRMRGRRAGVVAEASEFLAE